MPQSSRKSWMQLQRRLTLFAAVFLALLLIAPNSGASPPCAACSAAAYQTSSILPYSADHGCSTIVSPIAECAMPCCCPSAATHREAAGSDSVRVNQAAHAHRHPAIACSPCNDRSLAVLSPRDSSVRYAAVQTLFIDAPTHAASASVLLDVQGPPDCAQTLLYDVRSHCSSGLSPPLA